MSKLRARRLLAAAAVAAVALFGTGASVAHSASSSAQGPSWVTYPLPAGVDASLTTQQQVQGQRVVNGCMFSFTGTAATGSPELEWDEVAFDPATCAAVYAVGPVQDATAGPGDSSDAAGAGDANGNAYGHDKHGGADPTSAFYLRTFYEDPVGIDVTSLRNDVEWTYNYTCNSSYKWKRTARWYTLSGWYLRYVNDRPSLGCNNAISNSDALMENDFFCSPESVYTHYNFNHEVDGKPNGSVVYSWNDYVDSTFGICYRLLSHHHSQGFETPW
jgi:hypothetical protein